MTVEKIKFIFGYHTPDEETRAKHARVNDEFENLALVINECMPDGPGATVAIRKLAEARQSVHAAIALKGEF